MFERTKARAVPVVNQAADNTPVVIACCNACRVCVTSNVLGLIFAGAAAASAGVVAVAKRLAKRARS